MKYLKILLLAAGLSGVAACQQQSADNVPVDKSPALATVNGEPITRDFFEFYVKAVTGKGSSELTAEQREQALDNLIRAKVIAARAVQDGVAREKDTAALLELSRLNVLQQAASEDYLEERKPTEQELRSEYETQVAALPRLEYRARHILVATEPFADKLVRELKRGADFAALARRESMDSSKQQGGDLGWFTPDRMVKPFAEAVMALKPGEYTTQPVQTQYGWHIVKLEETREVDTPAYETVKPRLEQVVQAKKVKAWADDLVKAAKVEKHTEAAQAEAPAEPAAEPESAEESAEKTS